MKLSNVVSLVENWSQKAPLRFALIVNAIGMALILLFFRCSYQTNDDPAMAMIAAGSGIGLKPDEHLIFTNVLIGFALKGLYTLNHVAPWYGLYLLTVQYLSHTALLYSLLVWRFTRRHFELYCLFLATVGVYFVTNLQFTSVAFYATQSGVILGLTAICKRSEMPELRIGRWLAASAGMIVLGGMIRFHSFLGNGLICLPLSALVLWPLRKRGVLRAALVWGVAAIGMTLAVQNLHQQYFARDPEWNGFYTYNRLRIIFHDFNWLRYDQQTRAAFDHAHWTHNDYQMMQLWYYDDAQIYSEDKLRSVLNEYVWMPQASFAERVLDVVVDVAWNQPAWPVLFLLPLFVALGQSRRLTFQAVGICLLAALAILIAMVLYAKQLPARVYYPMFAFLLPVALLAGRLGPEAPPIGMWMFSRVRLAREATQQRGVSLHLVPGPRWSTIGCFGIALIAVTTNALFELSNALAKAASEVQLRRAIARINPRDDELFVAWGCNLKIEDISPLTGPGLYANFHLLQLGWPQRTPHCEAMKRHFHIDNLVTALSQRSNLFLISVDALNQHFDEFARQHHGLELEWRQCFQCPQFEIWKPSLWREPASDFLAPRESTQLGDRAEVRRFQ